MNQVSRPMQIALGAVLVFAVVWFAVLRPKDPAADVAAAPVTPVQTTPAADAGGATAKSELGSTVESAKNAGAAADAAVKKRESQTGETDETQAAAQKPAASTPASDAPAASTPSSDPSAAATTPKAAEPKENTSQERANTVVNAITRDLEARRAVVVLVWAKSGEEDRVMHKRVTKQIDRRKGKVKIYLIPVSEVGRYDGLLGGLSLGQIPSTVVIAPNNQAKVLGGLSSTVRIDRLTSSATQIKPVATTP